MLLGQHSLLLACVVCWHMTAIIASYNSRKQSKRFRNYCIGAVDERPT